MAESFDPLVAKALLAPHLGKLRTASYAELAEKARHAAIETFEAADSNGDAIRSRFFRWDGAPERDVRALGFAFMNPSGKSINDDFIMAPDGRFVGE